MPTLAGEFVDLSSETTIGDAAAGRPFDQLYPERRANDRTDDDPGKRRFLGRKKPEQRTPMSTEAGIHERQQYAIYAWLLALLQSEQRKPGRLQLGAPTSARYRLLRSAPTAIRWRPS